MANSVNQNRQGPLWALGSIIVVTPGVPVSIMSLVDAAKANAPESATSTTSDEYTFRAQQISFQGFKSNAGSGVVNNTGNVYIIGGQKVGSGSGNRTDYGAILWVLGPGLTWVLGSAASRVNVFSPYYFSIDADNANDAAQVTLIIQ